MLFLFSYVYDTMSVKAPEGSRGADGVGGDAASRLRQALPPCVCYHYCSAAVLALGFVDETCGWDDTMLLMLTRRIDTLLGEFDVTNEHCADECP